MPISSFPINDILICLKEMWMEINTKIIEERGDNTLYHKYMQDN